MPRRDEQEFEERRQQIIRGALAVFAARGFERATNRDIARASGIGSPGLIYHYFRDKADLFRAVLEQRSPALQIFASGDLMLDRPPDEVLGLIGRAFLATMADAEAVALFRLVLGEALRRPDVAAMLNDGAPARAFAFLTRYLAAQMDAGVLRRADPGVATRCFIGPLVLYVLSREVFPQPDSASLTSEHMVAETVRTFLQGLGYRKAGAA